MILAFYNVIWLSDDVLYLLTRSKAIQLNQYLTIVALDQSSYKYNLIKRYTVHSDIYSTWCYLYQHMLADREHSFWRDCADVLKEKMKSSRMTKILFYVLTRCAFVQCIRFNRKSWEIILRYYKKKSTTNELSMYQVKTKFELRGHVYILWMC